MPPLRGPGAIEYFGFEIATEPMPEDPPIPLELLGEMESLYDTVHEAPAQAIDRLEAIVRAYPRLYTFKNWLMAAYHGIGRHDTAAELTERIFEEHPDYLFGRFALVELRIRQDRLDEAAALLGVPPDLKQLCPERTLFHSSEVCAFYAIAASYYIARQQLQDALRFSALLHAVNPNGPQAEHVDKQLALLTMQAAMKRLAAMAKRGRDRT